MPRSSSVDPSTLAPGPQRTDVATVQDIESIPAHRRQGEEDPVGLLAATRRRVREWGLDFYRGVTRRTLRQWVERVVYYILFNTALHAFTFGLIAFYYASQSSDKPALTGARSILNLSPGLTIRPLNPAVDWSHPLDWLVDGQYDPIEDITKTLLRMQGPYFNTSSDPTTGGCSLCSEMSQYGTLPARCDSDTESHLPSPCLLLKLNRIYGFVPHGQKVKKTTSPCGENTTTEETVRVAKLECTMDGETGGIQYLPQQGFPVADFPYEKTKKSPFVFLRFTNLTNRGTKEVICKMDDPSIQVETGDPGDWLGYVKFRVAFVSSPETEAVPLSEQCCVCNIKPDVECECKNSSETCSEDTGSCKSGCASDSTPGGDCRTQCKCADRTEKCDQKTKLCPKSGCAKSSPSGDCRKPAVLTNKAKASTKTSTTKPSVTSTTKASTTTEGTTAENLSPTLINRTRIDEMAGECRRGATEASLPTDLKKICDTTTDYGGWIVFQRRLSSKVDFYRTYSVYENGFGDINGNYWLGLRTIHDLCPKKADCQLWVNFKQGTKSYHAKYDSFAVGGAADGYKLTVEGFTARSSNVPSDRMSYHNGMKFSTYDKDQDTYSGNCARKNQGAWWFEGCHRVLLNGPWNGCPHGMWWWDIDCPLTDTEMKLRQETVKQKSVGDVISGSDKPSVSLMCEICVLLFVVCLCVC